MRRAKSDLLSALLRSFRKAQLAEKHPALDVKTLVDLGHTDVNTRRKFLKDVGQAIALIGISTMMPLVSCHPTRQSQKGNAIKLTKNNARIAIVGGGIAGLNCAYQLRKKGIIAQLYEADKRVGGRIYTRRDVFADGLQTEFGAEFIDTNHSDLISLIKELNLEMYDTFEDIKTNHLIKETFYLNDRHMTEEDVIKEFRKIAKQIETDRSKVGVNYDTPFCISLDQMSLEAYIRGLNCETWLQDLLIYAYTAEYGLEAGDQSSLNFVDMIGIDTSLSSFAMFGDSDERYKVRGGNMRITEALSDIVKDQIHTGQRLIAIQQKGDAYHLIFENKTEVIADMVVLTLPFSVLRDVDIQVDDMTEEKRACIDQLGYGQNNKLILGFNSRPWRENNLNYAGYVVHRDIQNGWDSSQMQNGNVGAGSYTIFLGGDSSIKMGNLTSAQNMRDQVTQTVLQNYLGTLNTIFPGAKEQFNGIQKAALWTNNPFSKGSYSAYRTGQWTTLAGQEITPIGNIFFAGEHCSENFIGFMNGGSETGRWAAENILAKLS